MPGFREKNYLYKNLLQSNAVNSLFVVVGSENGLCAPKSISVTKKRNIVDYCKKVIVKALIHVVTKVNKL